jgi:Jhy protein
MSSIAFQQRFKYKTGVISSTGDILINPLSAVQKPNDKQSHSSVIKSSASYILKSKVPSPMVQKATHLSDNSFYTSIPPLITDPDLSKASIELDKPQKLSHKQSQARFAPFSHEILKNSGETAAKGYKPYTLKDYNIIRPKNYYQLGGLGPNHIGNEDWAKKKELNHKRWKYGYDTYLLNAANLPLRPNKPDKLKSTQDNSRKRALEFAKNIPKPPIKFKMY